MDKLHLERNLLQATKENIGQGLSVFDKDLKLVMANENFRKILDYPEDLVEPGTPYEDIVRYNIERRGDVDPNSSVEELVKEAIDFSSRSEALKFEREFKNGKIIRVSGNPMPDGGFVHTYLDITDQKQMEDDLIQAKENAEKATSAKSNFLATMSHEIRTPLNGVLGMAQLLHSTELNADQTTKVDNILSSGTSLLEILNDILDMSKIEAGNMQLEECVFDLGELINSVSEPFIILSNDRNITFEINELDVATTLVKGDKTRLRQILQNLLSNAFKFTFSGKITISTFLVEKNATVDGCNLFRIDVEDTGEGIAPDRTSSVFDVFVQEDDTITRKFGGSGLGLSIVRNLIELMDGEIKLTSEVGVGSKFSIFLPFQKVTENEKTSYVQNDQPKTIDAILPLKILVAEDNMVNAMITKAMLEQGGHNVEFAVNGKIAVDYLKKDMPDVILMDVHMPIMSGIEATEIIRSTHDHSKLPIIGVTAEAFSERIAQLREVGMNDVLTKPFTRDQLNAILLEYGSPKVLQ
ncbi:hypothetical protein A9Q83_12780 [Alphaproteobacteria bacterium 46_93_T64]|nr:hypothetical protein A9Q83_12780 [Alphaproteobacteria bacterium 46_93_T64]